ncbi:hypothetical protein SPRG_10289 [Saprolegnia parasitica CBS 223.65]|uniref:Uncharacterized protein n=1 Tax=Saprolegnia parasitica (strain CBS 223.65) TaxID=695850 RepID=A0A067C1Q4_SAPPC|nr:hypothetical protein SPRG_10289 [Saprolegnia parasitica CBS 223.65]KDO24473.1 hypothetical protein SPRG_10289 [Saprolegnia parasitica CBS 223.65]|eukprot:XP_012204739.1 hypothetical protein SPRG_10289 [Saprolegnia parasitica CBS 223.65]
MESSQCVGQALVGLRPLRHMLDVEATVPIFADDGAALGRLAVRLRPSTTPSVVTDNRGVTAKRVPDDVDDLSDNEVESLEALAGTFIWLSLATHLVVDKPPTQLVLKQQQYCLEYAFGQANAQTTSMAHEQTIKVLVNHELVQYVSTDVLAFSVRLASRDPSKALMEQLGREHATMLEEAEKERRRNDALLAELTNLVGQVKSHEDELRKQAEKSQAASSELAKAQEKARADVREREALQRQLQEADAKWQVLATTAENAKSKVCCMQ